MQICLPLATLNGKLKWLKNFLRAVTKIKPSFDAELIWLPLSTNVLMRIFFSQ